MGEIKRYKLRRNISDPRYELRIGSIFTQGERNSKDSAYSCGNYVLHPSLVEHNPYWFEEVKPPIEDKPERIKVTGIQYTGHSFEFTTSCSFGHDKLTAIKQAIEYCLNDIIPGEIITIETFNKKKFTEEDMEEARRRAFNAARLMIITNENKKLSEVVVASFKDLARHKNAEDYLDSLNTNKFKNNKVIYSHDEKGKIKSGR